MQEAFTRDDIQYLVHDFYHHIQEHPTLGPIFDAHVTDWPVHLDTMVSFWSSLLLRTGDFSGSPMMKHAAIPELSATLFESWLHLFKSRCEQLPNQALGQRAYEFSTRIARSLWMGYQIQKDPLKAPNELTMP